VRSTSSQRRHRHAVGDMIFNQQITTLPEPHHRQLLRLMQEADIAYGNLEFSINDRPELHLVFYNFALRQLRM
jgi:hypothetical protein